MVEINNKKKNNNNVRHEIQNIFPWVPQSFLREGDKIEEKEKIKSVVIRSF